MDYFLQLFLRQSKYVKALIILVVILLAVLAILTFSNHRYLPNWDKIGTALFGSNETEVTEDYIRFINVGQGDSVLISSNGYNALVDFGNKSDYGNGLLEKLRSYGIKELDCIFVSHYDEDHVGGGAMLLDAMKVHYAVLPEQADRGEEPFPDFQYALENNGTEVCIAQVGTLINIGDFNITVIGYYRGETEPNDRSIVLMAELFGKKFLLTGDAGEAVEQNLIIDRINLDCDVLKVAHHGSRGSTTETFVAATTPRYAVISAGPSNAYGHPHQEVLNVLNNANVQICRTDRNGDITFRVENGRLNLETEY